MALTKEIIIAKFEFDIELKTVSIRTDTVVKEDGVELSRSSHRCAFVPGDIDKAVGCLGVDAPEVIYLKAIWTDQVISDYKAAQAAQE